MTKEENPTKRDLEICNLVPGLEGTDDPKKLADRLKTAALQPPAQVLRQMTSVAKAVNGEFD